jgi:proline iminopeptidase
MNRITKWLGLTLGGLLGVGAVGFVGSYLGFAGQYVVPATTTDDPSLPSRSVAGYRFHLEVFGLPTRPVVIVLHGGPGGDYRSLLPLKPLSDDYQLVFYDQRGSGLSPRVPDDQLTLDQFVEDLHAIVGVTSPHSPVRLIGHSWGAMLAAAYVDRHPDSVSHAVLAEPAFLTAEQGNQWYEQVNHGQPPLSLALLEGVWRSWIESLYVYGPDEDARRDFFTRSVMSLDVPGHPFAGYYCAGAARGGYDPVWRSGSRAFRGIVKHAMDNGRFTQDLVSLRAKRFPHKVLLVAGRCNSVIGPEVQRQNVGLFANAELAVIDDAGHSMFGERPEASLAVLKRYLGENHTAIVASGQRTAE